MVNNFQNTLASLMKNQKENSLALANMLLSPKMEKEATKNMTPEQKAEFKKSKQGSKYMEAMSELKKQMDLLNKMDK